VRASSLLLAALSTTTILTAIGADAQDSPALEEVLVTAQKRVQSLHEVPVSVNAVSGDKLEKASLTNIQTLADYIPSFNMTQTGIGTNIAIRGISSGVNQGFEQSAAQFVDGIHFGRAQLSRTPFLDVERVEVLRGPQSILFGKNSTAGAVSIISAKPTQEFMAKMTALYSADDGERDLRFVISSPLNEELGLRIALLDSKIDGYMDNTTLNRDESGDRSRVVRGTLQWQPEDWDVTLKAESGSFDSDGRNIEVIHPVINPQASGTPVPYANVLEFLTGGNYHLDATHDWKRQSNGDYSYNNTRNLTLNVEHQLGDFTLASVTGYNAYDYQELCDCDFTGASGFNILSDEDYSQFSQELRIASPEKETFSYLGGLFFQTADLKFHDNVYVPQDSFIAQAISAALRGASAQRDFNQTTDIYAIFGQATWSYTDWGRLILGARYTDERKDAGRHQYYVTPDGVQLPQGSPTDLYNLLWATFRIDPHQIKGKRSEGAFTPLVTAQFDLNATDMLYLSFTTGFKSGGFDVRSNAAPNALDGIYDSIQGTWEFEDEKVRNYELGGKFVLGEGAAELNTAIFRSEFDNMQTSQFDGSLSFNVTNAGQAVVQGLEADSRWALSDALLWRGGLAYIDFEYTDFPNSQCYFGQVDNIAPFGDGACDATGKRREFTPKWQGNTGLDYTLGFANGLKLVSTLDLIFSSSYFTTPSLDPKLTQDAFTKINARIALSGRNDEWELALIGKNLSDQSVVTYANGLPAASTLTGGTSSGYYAFYERPRSIALQATVKF